MSDGDRSEDFLGSKRLDDYYDAWVQAAAEARKWESRFYELLGVLVVFGLAISPKLTLAIAGIVLVIDIVRGKLQDRRTMRWLEDERQRAERQQQEDDGST
ncbi:hypothetical protein [Burkholderia sp. MSMB1498]|uniref:hypothetical protein n=1 Tax=Burkholderia sp. MSMB1498 TaxID=1637842 RepID=UPI000A7C5781|nr:hypothetical protein [Burkholderia sp. MSMB1498]